jgi:hypothetical protein
VKGIEPSVLTAILSQYTAIVCFVKVQLLRFSDHFCVFPLFYCYEL